MLQAPTTHAESGGAGRLRDSRSNVSAEHLTAVAATLLMFAVALISFGSCGGADLAFPGSGLGTPTPTVVPTATP